MKVAICTWNAGQTLHKEQSLSVSTWFEDETVNAQDGSMTNSDRGSDDQLEDKTAPAIYAIGFQESVPLPEALLGSPAAQLTRYEQKLQTEVQAHAQRCASTTKEDLPEYILVRKVVMGAIALFVYAEESLASQIKDVCESSVGCGPLFMSNKGAVGVRFGLKGRSSTWTFVTAHLAAHDYNLERRNLDWRNIVSRLLFHSKDGSEKQLYDSSHLFVCGDLNYRISTERPVPLTLGRLGDLLEKKDVAQLLKHDQLASEVEAKKTLHGLSEGQITFLPSYKYKVGTDTYKGYEHRTPSYCDRILHAFAEDEVDVLSYRSIMAVKTSDHKPVSAVYQVTSLKETEGAVRTPKTLSAPYPPDPSNAVKQAVGFAMDRIVGGIWSLAILAGFGNDKVGALVLVVGVITAFVAARKGASGLAELLPFFTSAVPSGGKHKAA